MLKKLLLGAWVVLLPCSSYSDSIKPYYGYTGNAASGGLSWDMNTLFPPPPGLEVNAVIYNYTIRKAIEDSVTVNVQNENAQGTGYIFRSQDDWLPGSMDGTEINKVIGLPNIPREYWGNGSIDVQGNGSVDDPSVIYSYRIDPCYDPQYSPNCPGYQQPKWDVPEVDYSIYSNIDINFDREQYNPEDELHKEAKTDEELENEKAEEEKDSKERLEKALAAADNSALFAQALATSQLLDSINAATNMNSYYAASIQGGTYEEAINLVDKKLPENKKGLRNGFAQQLLHQQMVDSQFK
jgi:hypothetical protein